MFKTIKITGMLWCLLLMNQLTFATIPKVIRFATEPTYPPFEYIDSTGTMKGFDIDIANALCQQMQVQCTFSNQSFNSLIPSLNLGKYDAIIASLGVTPERQKQVLFTNAYYQPSASFVGPIDKHYSLQHLDGLAVGVQQGTTFESYLRTKYNNKVVVKSYGSVQEAFLDLESGRIDAVLADSPIVYAWLKDNASQFGIIDQPITDNDYFGSGYAIAVNKKNPDLVLLFNQALSKIKANGTYTKISQHYFHYK